MTRYSDIGNAINDFLSDFSNARQRAETLDDRILHAAAGVSPDYQDLVSLAVRQVYGATELTVAMGTDGKWNTSDVMMFMKNIGGTTARQARLPALRRVNPVEILYAAWPMFMYLDPALGPPLLEPLLRFQDSPAWPNPYAAQDAGQQYPAVKPTTGMHNQRIEQTSNMIIMVYAHMATTGDSSLVARYYNLLKSWADFLVQNSMDISGDSFQDTLFAFVMVFPKVVDEHDFQANATALTTSWKSTALTDKNRILGSFGNNGSWTLGYNVFADAWLKTGIVDQDVFQAQNDLFTSLLLPGQKTYQYGLPIDSQGPLNGAASSTSSISDNTTRNTMISLLRAYASYNGTNAVFADIYDSETGQASSGQASPAQGAMFAPLVLNQIGGNSGSGSSHTLNSSPRVHAGAIAGGVVGGIALVGGITVLVIWLLRCRKRERGRRQALTLEPEDQQEMSWVTPFTSYYDTSTGGSQSALAIGQHQATPLQTTSDSGRPMLQEASSSYTESAAARKRQAALGISTSSPSGEDLHNPDPESAAAVPSGAEASRNLEREVERLRREMEVIQAERARDLAPPSYDETRAAND
ncbi:hypothetical protein EWM64_g1355 [Hericium alpestre]|uniref:Glutaminase A central domain-containing protein n=1 Tax=Hericium alpestre TaxID=135208 RepID=A0A4Z0A846_9AGAM|nr:hypothetical protein EWM64_g1355 [Hericium alpestre]